MLDVGKPSMQNFYNNLGRVVRGEWWFHPNADEAAYMDQIRSGKEEASSDQILIIYYAQDSVVKVAAAGVMIWIFVHQSF